MTKEMSPSLRDLYARIDEQIAAGKAIKPPGDRRRDQGQPPEGQQERRTQPDRRSGGRKQ